VPFAKTDSPEDPAQDSFQRWALDLEAHVGGLSWCERRGRG